MKDLLDFEADTLYFDEPLSDEVQHQLDLAAEQYGTPDAEQALLQAYFLEPEHPLVLVALYRYFYYQHRLEEALLVADRVLRVFARRLRLPESWQKLDKIRFGGGVMVSMTMIRFYLLALKGAGYLELRLGRHLSAIARLKKVSEFDKEDRLGVQALMKVAQMAVDQEKGVAAA